MVGSVEKAVSLVMGTDAMPIALEQGLKPDGSMPRLIVAARYGPGCRCCWSDCGGPTLRSRPPGRSVDRTQRNPTATGGPRQPHRWKARVSPPSEPLCGRAESPPMALPGGVENCVRIVSTRSRWTPNVVIAGARGRTHLDHSRRIEREFHIVHEAEHRRTEFHMKVVLRGLDPVYPRHAV